MIGAKIDSELISILYLMFFGLVISGTFIALAIKNRMAFMGASGFTVLSVIVYMTIRLFFNHATLPSIFYIGDSVLQMIISVVVALTVCLVGIWLLQNYINKRNKEGNNE